MLDVLQDEQNMEEDAKAVLGAADDKNCTYNQGYMVRQALYACLTCCPADSAGGVCLACTYSCHDGHDIVELYTKRNFCCDCGNDKFKSKGQQCKLVQDKRPTNTKNKYNQNFRGVYCVCHRPYPDPEDPVSDSMIQCILCEDWFHGRHLVKESKDWQSRLPKEDSYSEMICHLCHATHHQKFLHAYTGYSVLRVVENAKSDDARDGTVDTKPKDVDVVGEEKKTDVKKASQEGDKKEAEEDNAEQKIDDKKADVSVDQNDSKADMSVSEEECFLKRVATPTVGKSNNDDLGALFMVSEWRERLCKCPDCTKMYLAAGLAYLPSKEDTVHHYEEQAKAAGGSQYEEGMKALSSMDRVKQVEAIHGYNSMKSNLMEYLKKFAENGKVVREEDIQEFFQQMSANKRPKVDMSFNCR